MTPVLTTSRIALRPYYAGNVTDDHVAWLNDPKVVKYSEQRHVRHTLESVHQYVNNLHRNPNSHIWGIYVPLSIKNSDPHHLLMGTITAHVDDNNGVANMGILIGKEHWGKGYGQESWQAVCNWLFETEVRKIEAGCHYENRAMRSLAETCGMHMEGVRHDHFIVNGTPQHLLLYAKMKPVEAKVSVDDKNSRVLGKTG